MAALESYNNSRDSSKSAESEIITIMRRMEGAIAGEGTDNVASKTRALVEDVNRTRALIQLSEGDLKRLKKKKRKLSSDTEKNAKKIKAIKKKIKPQEAELETAEGGSNTGPGKSVESDGDDSSSNNNSSDNDSSDNDSSDEE